MLLGYIVLICVKWKMFVCCCCCVWMRLVNWCVWWFLFFMFVFYSWFLVVKLICNCVVVICWIKVLCVLNVCWFLVLVCVLLLVMMMFVWLSFRCLLVRILNWCIKRLIKFWNVCRYVCWWLVYIMIVSCCNFVIF